MQMIGEQETSEIISKQSYTGTLLIGSLPIIGDLFLASWSTSENIRESKRNLCKAYLTVKISLIYPILVIVGVAGFFAGRVSQG